MLDLLPDLFDDYPDALTLAKPVFRDFGDKTIFYGEIVTVDCFNDNSKVKEVLATNGVGKVLVVNGQGSLNRALLGDMIAESAVDNHWQGVIINGCIRDAGTIATLDLGVKALATCPIKTEKLGQGEVNVPVTFADVHFIPGQYVYADANGIAVSERMLPVDNSI